MKWATSLFSLFIFVLGASTSPVIVRSNGTSLGLQSADAKVAGITITGLTVNGSGCPSGSAQSVLSSDKTSITVLFSKFAASAGPGIAASKNRESCQISLGLSVPSGTTVAMTSVDFRGYYQLASKVTATQSAIYYFQGSQIQSNANGNIAGPVTGAEYTYRNTFPVDDSNRSPCGTSAVLNIVSSISVSNSGNTAGSGFITDDSIDASLHQVFNLKYGTC